MGLLSILKRLGDIICDITCVTDSIAERRMSKKYNDPVFTRRPGVDYDRYTIEEECDRIIAKCNEIVARANYVANRCEAATERCEAVTDHCEDATEHCENVTREVERRYNISVPRTNRRHYHMTNDRFYTNIPQPIAPLMNYGYGSTDYRTYDTYQYAPPYQSYDTRYDTRNDYMSDSRRYMNYNQNPNPNSYGCHIQQPPINQNCNSYGYGTSSVPYGYGNTPVQLPDWRIAEQQQQQIFNPVIVGYGQNFNPTPVIPYGYGSDSTSSVFDWNAIQDAMANINKDPSYADRVVEMVKTG